MEMETVCQEEERFTHHLVQEYREYLSGLFHQPRVTVKVQLLSQHTLWTRVRQCHGEGVFSSCCVILQPSKICWAAFCLHLLACWANGSRTSRFSLTWYILKGMYLKPPSSVEYSISFLFMAQNWSNLSVTRQKQKPVSNSTHASVLHEKVLLFNRRNSVQIILGLSQVIKPQNNTNTTVSSLLFYRHLTQTRGARPRAPSATVDCQWVNFGLFATWNQCVVVLDSSHEGRGWPESFQKHPNISSSPTVKFKLSVLSQIERTSKQHVFISNLPPHSALTFTCFLSPGWKCEATLFSLCFCPVLDVKVWG